MERGKQGTKGSVLVEGTGLLLGVVVVAANRHNSLLLRPTMESVSRFGPDLPEQITVHLDASYVSKATHGLLE